MKWSSHKTTQRSSACSSLQQIQFHLILKLPSKSRQCCTPSCHQDQPNDQASVCDFHGQLHHMSIGKFQHDYRRLDSAVNELVSRMQDTGNALDDSLVDCFCTEALRPAHRCQDVMQTSSGSVLSRPSFSAKAQQLIHQNNRSFRKRKAEEERKDKSQQSFYMRHQDYMHYGHSNPCRS